MSAVPAKRQVHASSLAAALVALIFLALCLGPHLLRIRTPSLFADDVSRLGDLQSKPLNQLLFRPIQEHMAPVFETISWVTWNLAGHRLTHAPLAFTLASYVPFVLSLWLLGWLVQRELGSLTTSLTAVAAYSLSTLNSEAIYWYSGSSFLWAMLWTLMTLRFAHAATTATEGRRGNLLLATLAAALAPACSAIGLLAGPVGAIRLGVTVSREGHRKLNIVAFVPLLGTVLTLAICSLFRYHNLLAARMGERADFGSGLIYVICAPTNVLLPGIFGVGYIKLGPAVGLNVGVALIGLTGIMGWARRSSHRALILCGLWLILGGYVMTYCFRIRSVGTIGLFNVERYHVFPLLGFTLLLVVAARPWLRRFDARPLRSIVAATVLAALLMLVHLPTMVNRTRFYDFANQHSTLAALERMDEICRRERISRDQVLAATDPLLLKWGNGNVLRLIPESVMAPEMSDSRVRQTLLAALSPAEREALWGGMDAAPYLTPDDQLEKRAHVTSIGQLVGSHRVRSADAGQRVAAGWPAYLEFEMPDEEPGVVAATSPGRPATRALCLPRLSPKCPMEVWWTDANGGWSETRSMRLRIDPVNPTRDWAISLDKVPHWGPANSRRIRLMFRTAGSFTVDAPQLLR